MMAKIETWFPVAVFLENDLFPQENNEQWRDHLLNLKKTVSCGGDGWMGGTYTTHETYNLSTDKLFEPLIDKITECVHEFARAHNSFGTYKCTDSWANIAVAGNFQEFHTHDGCIFSAVYYVTSPEGSGQIVFEDPKQPDMLPLLNIQERNFLSFIRAGYTPKGGMLIIFRSYLRHLVEAGTNTDERISISLNFK
jgi:uncharacterized protein (TIGR02466 family)